MKDKILKIGLDFETSTGTHPTLAPIQLGITVQGQHYESLIGGWTFDDSTDIRWSEESAKIHNLTQEQLKDAPSIFEVDIFASAWILPLVQGYQRMNRIVVGWNVGSFDRRIVNTWMPNLDKILSYRTLDLNTVCYFAADLLNASYGAIKKEVKTKAALEIGWDGEEATWHNALFDARAGLLNYDALLAMADLDVEKMIKPSI